MHIICIILKHVHFAATMLETRTSRVFSVALKLEGDLAEDLAIAPVDMVEKMNWLGVHIFDEKLQWTQQIYQAR